VGAADHHRDQAALGRRALLEYVGGPEASEHAQPLAAGDEEAEADRLLAQRRGLKAEVQYHQRSRGDRGDRAGHLGVHRGHHARGLRRRVGQHDRVGLQRRAFGHVDPQPAPAHVAHAADRPVQLEAGAGRPRQGVGQLLHAVAKGGERPGRTRRPARLALPATGPAHP
jgi:hypothetical protein